MKSTLIENLKQKKLKVTPQRLAIYSFLYEAKNHPSAETIYKAVYTSFPSISLATIYKTLGTLKNSGLIQEINVCENSYRYDPNNEPHPHIICDNCHAVYDIMQVKCLDGLKKEISQTMDFTVVREQLFFYGICPSCKANDVPNSSCSNSASLQC